MDNVAFLPSACVFTCTKLANHYAPPQKRIPAIVGEIMQYSLVVFDALGGPVGGTGHFLRIQQMLDSITSTFVQIAADQFAVLLNDALFNMQDLQMVCAIPCRARHHVAGLFESPPVGRLYQILMFAEAC